MTQTETKKDRQSGAGASRASPEAQAVRAELASMKQRDPVLQYVINDPEAFAQNLAKALEQGGRAFAAYFEPIQKGQGRKDYTAELTEYTRTLGRIGQYWMSDPQRTLEAQSRLWAGYMDLYTVMLKRMAGEQATPVVEPDPKDKRFTDEEWSHNQFFDFLKQAYLLSARWAQSLVDEAEDLDEHTRRKASFYMKQLLNAVSPSNFLLTNPELLRETAQESGANLVRGMTMLAEDIERGGGELRLRQTDTDEFEVGHNIAITPGKVVAENDVRQLIQYTPSTETVAKAPLLIIPPWINKYYILDLNPEKSLIKWLVDHGRTVFVVSWINPDEAHAEKNFEAYMRDGLIESLDLVQKVTGEDRIDVLGYCVGGTLLGVTLAYLAATGDERVNTATFLTTQVDFTHAGDLKVFIDQEQLEQLEAQMKEKGYLEGAHMANAFNLLRSNDLIWPYVVNNYVRGKEPFPFDLLYWNSDATRMPYANHIFYMREFYLNNRLAKGELEIGGQRLNLGDVKVPIMNIATREDHIAPAKSVFTGNSLFGGPAEFVVAGSGHIAGIVNPPAKQKYQYWTDGPTEGTLEEWLERAEEHKGSWWPHWLEWLERHNTGEPVPAREPGGGVLTPIEDAPGRYVKTRY